MADVDNLRIKFNKVKQTLLSKLFYGESPVSEEEIQALVDHMSRSLKIRLIWSTSAWISNELLISTLENIDQIPKSDQRLQPREFLCAYAINTGDDWSESRWEIEAINGVPVKDSDRPLTVREFTQQMTANGWKTVSSPISTGPTNVYTPDGKLVYELYFCRDPLRAS